MTMLWGQNVGHLISWGKFIRDLNLIFFISRNCGTILSFETFLVFWKSLSFHGEGWFQWGDPILLLVILENFFWNIIIKQVKSTSMTGRRRSERK